MTSTQAICPSCQQTILSTKEHVLRNMPDMQLAYTICAHCSSSLLFFHVERDATITTLGMITDLQQDEVDRYWEGLHINESDVLAIHELIQESTVLRQLLNKRSL